MLPVRLFRAKIFNPLSEDEFAFFEDGGLAVESGGIIVGMGDYRDLKNLYADAEVSDFSDQWIVPGFIDTHVHVPQVTVVGTCQ